MKWSETHAGVINAASQRFWVAVGDKADTVAIRMNTDPDFVARLAALAVNPDSRLLRYFYNFDAKTVANFVATEKFCPGKTVDGIKVGWLGDNFKEHLLPKIESDEVAAEELAVNKLLKSSRDPAIITALGGEEKVEISLGQFWEFLKTANQKFWYVAYIRDAGSVLWTVCGYWCDDGWGFSADSLDRPSRWRGGRRFLSR